MKSRTLRGLLLAVAMLFAPSLASAAGGVSYLDTDRINQVPVSVANPLPVTCSTCSGGSGGGTPSNFSSAFPTAGTAIGVSNGTNMVPILQGSAVSASSLPVVIASDQAAVAVKQATAASLNATVVGTGTFAAQATLQAGSANVGNVNPATHGQCSTLCASDVLKNSAGVLYSFEVQADATLSGAAWYVMIFDATTLPADGTVTPAKCYAQPSGTTQMGGTLAAGGATFGTGIVIGVSTTGCYTKTASTHAYIAGDFQ